jgi:DNA-directed RNA polymerase subunit H (RpoH/RPB5)
MLKPSERTGKTGIETDDKAYHQIYLCERVMGNVEIMLKDRGYDKIELVSNFGDVLEQIFLYEDENYQQPIMSAYKDWKTKNEKICQVYISPFLKIRISTIRGIAEKLEITPNIEALILSSESPNPAAIAETSQKKLPMQILTFDDISNLIKDHKLVPTSVVKLSNEEVEELMKFLGIKNLELLPGIQINNSIVKYYAFALGDVLKMTYGLNKPYFRVVVNVH